MIAVIADDLTGAAELGGIGLRFNLKVEISFDVPLETASDLLIIATDSRSKSEMEAVEEIEKVTKAVSLLQPELIFKKVDSVLRGHVLAEISVQLKALNLKQALLVPANPALGRTLINGTYFINGEPIANTSFSSDPEFPVKRSDVFTMLRTNSGSVKVRKPADFVIEDGVVVGEAASDEDLKEWANQIPGNNILVAGGAGLFTVMLQSLNINRSLNPEKEKKFSGKKLFVSGTAFNRGTKLIKDTYIQDGPVKYIPEEVLNTEALNKWTDEIASVLEKRAEVIVSVDPDEKPEKLYDAVELRAKTAEIVKAIFQKSSIDELIIEGGSTAAAILKKLEINKLYPVAEYAPGVIRSLSNKPNLYITLKPGSYSWPKEVWMF